jgi:hypothetical protein
MDIHDKLKTIKLIRVRDRTERNPIRKEIIQACIKCEILMSLFFKYDFKKVI